MSQHEGEGHGEEEGGRWGDHWPWEQLGWLEEPTYPLQGPRLGPGERQHEPRSLYLLENEGFHSSDEGTKE